MIIMLMNIELRRNNIVHGGNRDVDVTMKIETNKTSMMKHALDA